MKFVRALIAAAVALVAAAAMQLATSSSASATDLPGVHTNDCSACWQIAHD